MGSKCYRKTTGGVSVAVGYRFRPTDEELLDHYLKNKTQDKEFKVNHIIPEIDICKYDPWDIPGMLFTEPDSPYYDMEWFFFGPRDYKYINSTRSNRATPHGYWKITGKELVIRARGSSIGTKKIMTFYERHVPKSKKTNWVMHEYNLFEDEANPNPKLAQRDFVLFRLKKNPDKKDTSVYAEGEPSSCNLSNCEDQAAADVTPESQDHSPSTLQSPACIEQGDVLQSPFGDHDEYSVTDKNDISTCDNSTSNFENEVMLQSPTYRNLKDFMYIDDASDFGNQTANNVVVEQPCTQPVENHPPPAEDYYSFTLQSPIYTELGSVPHVDLYENQWQSTYDDDEQVSNSIANFENPTTDGRNSERRMSNAAGMHWEGSFFHFP